MNALPLVDPRRQPALGRFYPFTAAIQQLPTPNQQNADGEALRSSWSPLPGHSAIAARVTSIETRRGNEIRDPFTVFEDRNYYIELQGYFPLIQEKMRVIATEPKQGTSTTYDIKSIHHDSQASITKLLGEVIA